MSAAGGALWRSLRRVANFSAGRQSGGGGLKSYCYRSLWRCCPHDRFVVHQCGFGNLLEVRESYQKNGVEVSLHEFINDVVAENGRRRFGYLARRRFNIG